MRIIRKIKKTHTYLKKKDDESGHFDPRCFLAAPYHRALLRIYLIFAKIWSCFHILEIKDEILPGSISSFEKANFEQMSSPPTNKRRNFARVDFRLWKSRLLGVPEFTKISPYFTVKTLIKKHFSSLPPSSMAVLKNTWRQNFVFFIAQIRPGLFGFRLYAPMLLYELLRELM